MYQRLMHWRAGSIRVPMRALLRASLAVCAVAWCARAVTVTIDKNTTYQSMYGFGTSWHAFPVRCKQGPFYVTEERGPSFYDSLLTDLGTTVLRTNEDLAGVAEFKAAADRTGVPFRFVCTIWGPPARMKANQSLHSIGENKNYLLPEYYDDFADWVVDSIVLRAKREFGVDLDAVAPQVEPFFSQPYRSCKYTFEQYRDMHKEVGRRFAQRNISAKLIGPTDLTAFPDRSGSYLRAIYDDPEAREYLDVVSTQYSASTTDAYEKMLNYSVPYGKPWWVNEGNSLGGTYGADSEEVEIELSDPGMKLARNLWEMMTYGRLTSWMRWWPTSSASNIHDGGWIIDTVHTPRYFVAKHFFRFIRPGAVHVRSESSDSDVLTNAFTHPVNDQFTVVMTNLAWDERSVNLSGSGLPDEFDMYQSSEGERTCALKGTVGAEQAITLPPRSVTTLFSSPGGDPIAVRALPPRSQTRQAENVSAPATILGLDGRVVGRGTVASLRAYAAHGGTRAAHGVLLCVPDGPGKAGRSAVLRVVR
ncbi:MAG: hypothetical protein GF331_26590 [Chitinivibrionales bacterium]|nr:hypothetical protein [Chitinivibrionales bacterium]